MGMQYEDRTERNKQIDIFFEQLINDKDDREYLLKYLASTLYHENKEQIIVFLTGQKGSNGKSLLLNLIQKTFGSYQK